MGFATLCRRKTGANAGGLAVIRLLLEPALILSSGKDGFYYILTSADYRMAHVRKGQACSTSERR